VSTNEHWEIPVRVTRIRAGGAFLRNQAIFDTMKNESTPTDSAEVVEEGVQALDGAVSAVDRLEDEPDEILLRHVAANSDGGVSDRSDLSLYSASVFLLQERGYETDTEDGRLVVFDPGGDAVDPASLDPDTE
jgi:hypothetical protein